MSDRWLRPAFYGAILLATGVGACELRQQQPLPTPAGSCHYRMGADGTLPDPACTPGVADRRVTQDNIASTICRPGYAASVRPPVEYTNRLKAEQMRAYGAPGSSANYEEDHLIPLELGGSPDDPRNLWPQPGSSPNAKDSVENELHRQVCNHEITLAEAQRRISTDWSTAQ